MPDNDLRAKYTSGYHLIQSGVRRLYPDRAMGRIYAAEHLFSMELYPAYTGLQDGIAKLVNAAQPHCLIQRNPLVTIPRAKFVLSEIDTLASRVLDPSTYRLLLRFMGGMRQNIQTRDRTFLDAGLNGAIALHELVFCQTGRRELVTCYYEVRPDLVVARILPSIEELGLQGREPPLYQYRSRNPRG